jgi:RNA polymerase subunit RPABC4/transcription elongation factor Spt4
LQTCSRCNAIAPDTAEECGSCQANLLDFSTTAVSLRNLIANPRVSNIRINSAADACPLCSELRGTFVKESVPHLPHEGCSHPRGCRCTYEPVLTDIFP